MFKNMIAPVQAWLLSQNRCVGCGSSLKSAKTKKINQSEDEATCSKCPRIYIFNRKTKKYIRAPIPNKY